MRLYSLAGQPLALGYLFTSHPLLEDAFAILRRPKSRPGGRSRWIRWWRRVGM